MVRTFLLCSLLMSTLMLAACGGGSGDDDGKPEATATPKGPPPAKQVQAAVVAIIDTCIKVSFDNQTDTAPVSEQVDRMIALFKAYDPDAKLAPSDLRATTMRQALTQVRDQVRDCSPDDEDRINDTLSSVPASADAEPAPTAEATDTPAASTRRRGVATIAAELAPLCVERLTNGQQGEADARIAALVDDLVKAYRDGPKNEGTRHLMRVALSNLREGCGTDQTGKVADALRGG
jgi:hypothetical protein